MSKTNKDKVQFLLEVSTNKGYSRQVRDAARNALDEMGISTKERKRYSDVSEFVDEVYEDINNESKDAYTDTSTKMILKELKINFIMVIALIIAFCLFIGIVIFSNIVETDQTQTTNEVVVNTEKERKL